MMKYILVLVLTLTGSFANAGECVNGSCRNLRNKTVNVTKEVLSVPVIVTRKTVEATRNLGRKTVTRIRSSIR